MKKFAAVLITAMIISVSVSVFFNVFSVKSLPSEGTVLEKIEKTISLSIPLREDLSELMDSIRYLSGVRRFENIYIGSSGSLLLDIEKPSSRIFSLAENYILNFAEEKQIKPYFMLVPTSSAILQQEIDTFAAEDFYNQRNMINNMYSRFHGKVRTTDIYQTLYDHRDEYIYYHTENLPTSLGGYYIYGELCSRLGIEQNKIDSFSAAFVAHGFYGNLATDFLRPYSSPDFISFYEYTEEKNDPVIEYKNANGTSVVSKSFFVYDENKYTRKTDMVLGKLSPVIEIVCSGNSSTDGSILIFGDESAKSWLPFLATNFEKITFVQLNSATENLLSEIYTENYDQVLFAYSASDFVLGIDFEKLEYLG
ncbi:MAG: hypothetical protein IJA05_01305 [Oscillospiraceae bacterium]|nr:hypothetical protein [Oscillospiraceae bacterium]